MFELNKVKLSYKADGRVYSVTAGESVSNSRVSLDISREGDRFTASVTSKTPIELLKLSAEFACGYPADCRIFLNGYQSWTDSTEHTADSVMTGIDRIPSALNDRYTFSAYGDYTFVKYSRRRGCMHGFSYGYIRHGIGEFALIGSLNEREGFTIIRTDTEKGIITAEKDCAGLEMSGRYGGIALCLAEGGENEVFDRYFELMGIEPPKAQPIRGFTSWYRHYQDISETVIMNDLDGLIASGTAADVFQIDDGYQTAVGDWLSVDTEKFPSGMKTVADSIKAHGMRAGIWLAPFVCEEDSELYRSEPDMLLRDEQGRAVKCGNNWSGFYALDIYSPKVREYVRKVIGTAVNEWGYSLLKLDFLYAACVIPRRDKTRGQVMADAMELLRECAGSAEILGCGVPLASAFGMVGYCRIGTDVSLDWDDKAYMRLLHRERPSTRNTILNSVFRRQLSGRAFLNDPDVYLLREDENTMTPAQRRCLAEINVLTGGVLFTSDDMGKYGEAQREMLADMEALSGAEIAAAELRGSELIITIEKEQAFHTGSLLVIFI